MEVKIKVPETLKDIKLSQYQKFLRVTEGVEDEKKIAKLMVAIFCNIPDNVVNKMTKHSFDEILVHVLELLNIDDNIELTRTFKHNGVSYGFIPNMDDMTVGELGDLDGYITDWQKMDKAMGVLFRPVTVKVKDKYNIEDYKAGVSLDLPLGIVFGSYFFLNNLLQDLLNYTPNSIKSIVLKDPKSKALVENGVGINQFMESLEATCLSLKLSLN